MAGDVVSRWLSVSAFVVALLAFFFGGYFDATWNVSVSERSVIPSVDGIRYTSMELQEQEISIPASLQQASIEANYVPDLPSNMTRRELEAIVEGFSFADFTAASISLEAAATELERENTTPREAERIWGSLSASEKAVLYSMRAVRLLAEELRVTEDRIPVIIDRFLDQEMADGSDTEAFFNRPEVRRVLEQVLVIAAQAEFAPDATFLASLIREEVPRLNDVASEYERFASDINGILNDYDPETVWEVSVKLYNEGRSPAALLPVAVVAVQQLAQGNTSVFLRARDLEGNIIIAPGEAVDVVFRSSVEDNDEDVLQSLVGDFTGRLDFKVVLQYLDGERIESESSNFSTSVSESLRGELLEYSRSISIDP